MDEELYSKIVEYLSLSNPGESLEQLKSFAEKYEEFPLLLLNIISNQQLNSNARFISLSAINYLTKFYDEYISENVLNQYIESAFNIIPQLFLEDSEKFLNLAANILCCLIKYIEPNLQNPFLELIGSLFQNENTINSALECMIQVQKLSITMPVELLATLGPLITTSHQNHALEAIRAFINSDMQFLMENALPVIFENFQSFDTQGLSYATEICTFCFLETLDETCAEFISNAILSEDEAIAASCIDIFNDEINSIQLSPVIIDALMKRISVPNENPVEHDFCSWCQEILAEFAKTNWDDIQEQVMEFISDIDDEAYKLRILYCFLVVMPNSHEFVDEIFQCLQTDARGDAISALVSLSRSCPQIIETSIDPVIQLALDEDPYVSHMSLFAMQYFFDGDFNATDERLGALLQIYKEFQDRDAVNMIYIIQTFIYHMEVFSVGVFGEFLDHIIEIVLSPYADECVYCAYLDVFASIVSKSDAEFNDAFANVSTHLCDLMNSSNSDEIVFSCCEVLSIFASRYSEVIAGSNIPQVSVARALFCVGMDWSHGEMKEKLWNLILNMIKISPAALNENGQLLVERAESQFSYSQVASSIVISQILLGIIDQLEAETLKHFAFVCKILLSLPTHFPVFNELYNAIREKFAQNGINIDELLSQ